MQFLGFGSGIDGFATLSGTDVPIDSAALGTSGTRSLTATNASFTANQIILIHQSQGTGAGKWELNQIAAYTSGTITTTTMLANSYTTGAQVRAVKQYTGVTVSGTLTAKAWNGTTGGILAWLCAGNTAIAGTVSASGQGFRNNVVTGDRAQGEGTAGVPTTSNTANGNGGGGGGGNLDGGHVEAGHGGGGGNGTSGGSPGTRNVSPGGTGGSSAGAADLTTMTFGGAGGYGGNGFGSGSGRAGGAGGGLICIFSQDLSISGAVVANGNSGTSSNDRGGAGGGGAGGSIFMKGTTAALGTGLTAATGGSGGVCTGAFTGTAGSGGAGRVRIESCRLSGTTTPVASNQTGGFAFCGAATFIM